MSTPTDIKLVIKEVFVLTLSFFPTVYFASPRLAPFFAAEEAFFTVEILLVRIIRARIERVERAPGPAISTSRLEI
jgi:hypothetical protein